MSEDKGYSKEKADKLIQQHKEKAEALERQAKELEGLAGNPLSLSRKQAAEEMQALLEEAAEEHQKAENLKELKKHWGDE